jgi:hypothetical protein
MRNEQLEAIRAACIEAKPEIEHSQDGLNGVRPVRLTDVLLAVETGWWHRDRNAEHEISADTSKLLILWDFHQDDLTQQSDECIDFLADLLK